MIPPALRDAGDDPFLRGAPLAVLVWLYPRLEPHGYRAVKAQAVAWALRMQRQSVYRAMATLCRRGYLEEGPQDGQLRTYRVLLTRNTPVGAPNEHSRTA